ncbi:DUF3300 domain-containing protein [Thalassotalea ponticola]|uniref:DUF3300 domain-containing protein n=1 Tax=Thalassotalea ponticola TaxID=1523392 RepID=UPI0025B2AA50|nr:DUF3300 domain-containing protein [Thalassotalea ponticola]MDN3653083.1 DUF3300 domain-containing protein [Thalassotalea ponticola]
MLRVIIGYSSALLLTLLLSVQIASASEQEVAYQPYSQAELEQMLAPIALYPDSVLTHILVAATYPIEVIQAERFVRANPNLTNQQLIDKGEQQQWDPSVIALMPFADVLRRLSEQLAWTEQLGNAFLASEADVLAAVQRLRQRAIDAGTINDMDNMRISQSGKTIIIEPVEQQIVYVPYYDTRVIYGNWHWPHYPPVYWHHHASHLVHHYSPFYWSPAVHIAEGWFIFGLHWNLHHVIVRHHTHHSHYYRHYYKRHHKYYKRKAHSSSGYYRHANISKGNYHRWKHNNQHRRGVAYQPNVHKRHAIKDAAIRKHDRYTAKPASHHQADKQRIRANAQRASEVKQQRPRDRTKDKHSEKRYSNKQRALDGNTTRVNASAQPVTPNSLKQATKQQRVYKPSRTEQRGQSSVLPVNAQSVNANQPMRVKADHRTKQNAIQPRKTHAPKVTPTVAPKRTVQPRTQPRSQPRAPQQRQHRPQQKHR